MKKSFSSADIAYRRRYLFPPLADFEFVSGEIYLFHRSDPDCPRDSSLWGVFDRRIGNTIYLESSTTDYRRFRLWHRLPRTYRYCRLADRNELRDYVSNQTISEMSGLTH